MRAAAGTNTAGHRHLGMERVFVWMTVVGVSGMALVLVWMLFT